MSYLDLLSPLGIALAKKPMAELLPLLPEPGTSAQTRKLFSGVTPEKLFAVPIRDSDSANAVLAGLWLGHDALEESHHLSQAIDTTTGSFWHAIMHRREGDFSNAKYWYGRCGRHPALKAIAKLAAGLRSEAGVAQSRIRLDSEEWDGPALVDLVKSVRRQPADAGTDFAKKLQQIEWMGLFEYSVVRAADPDAGA
jgi:hypothetical protein